MIGIISTIIMMLMATAPSRALYKDAEKREEMAGLFVKAGEEYNIDPILLVVWSFGESSLRTDAKGSLGEVGVFQVHGVARRTCEAAGMNPSTLSGSIRCGALLIDMSHRLCGSLERGLYRYASGKCAGTPRARRIVKRRFRQWQELSKKDD